MRVGRTALIRSYDITQRKYTAQAGTSTEDLYRGPNYTLRFHNITLRFHNIPWKRVWSSLGTPLSDPSEEKQWSKLLHRAHTQYTQTETPERSPKSAGLDAQGARSVRVIYRAAHRPFRCSLPSPTHPPAVKHASLTGSQVAEASGGYVMCSRLVQNPSSYSVGRSPLRPSL